MFKATFIFTALVIGYGLAAISAQPATAQTARNLKCNGCVSSKDIKNKSIRTNDIRNNAVNGAKVRNGSLTAIDLGDEAGLEFAGGEHFEVLTPTAAVIETVTLSAPSSGFVIVHASGGFQFGNTTTIEQGLCSITTGTALDSTNQIRAGEHTADAMRWVPFASTRVFSAPAGGGSATYNLVCLGVGSAVVIIDTYLTALFVPTRY